MDKTKKGAAIKGPSCPMCQKPVSEEFRPFCSRRCADIDLGKWLSGSYVIAGGNADAEEDGLPDAAQLSQPENE